MKGERAGRATDERAGGESRFGWCWSRCWVRIVGRIVKGGPVGETSAKRNGVGGMRVVIWAHLLCRLSLADARGGPGSQRRGGIQNWLNLRKLAGASGNRYLAR